MNVLPLQLLIFILVIYSYGCVKILCGPLVALLRAIWRCQGAHEGSLEVPVQDFALKSVLVEGFLLSSDSSACARFSTSSCTFSYVGPGLALTVRNEGLVLLRKICSALLALRVVSDMMEADLLVSSF